MSAKRKPSPSAENEGDADVDASSKDEAPLKRAKRVVRPDVAARKQRNKETQFSVVKVGLASLGATREMREAIEHAVRQVQQIAYEAALLGNCTIVHALERGEALPPTIDQGFWRRCITRCYELTRSKRLPRDDEWKRLIDAGFDEVYMPARAPALPFANGDLLGTVLDDVAQTMATNTFTMLKTTFHNRLRHTIGREIDLHCFVNGLKLDRVARGAWLRTAQQRAVDPADATAWPETPSAASLRLALEAQLATWHQRYGTILPLRRSKGDPPLPPDRSLAPTLVRWLYEMRVQLDRSCAAVPEDVRTTVFRRGGLKTFSLLPFASPSVKHIQVSPTTLNDLLKLAYKGRDDARRPNGRAVIDAPSDFFAREFPGLKRLEHGTLVFQGTLRTDGVAASVVLGRPAADDATPCKGVRSGKGLFNVEPVDCDTNAPIRNRPVVPAATQRLVGIDPGRRDMLVGVVYKPHAELASCATFKMSTRRHVHESGRRQTKRATEARLARRVVGDGGKTLAERLQCLPSARVVTTEALQAHVRTLTPLLRDWLDVHHQRATRRGRFTVYARTDASLDKLCHTICGHRRPYRDAHPQNQTQAQAPSMPTLVAFGAASSCSSGFGYAPAPQRRLRRRLELHGARVSLIDEYLTSQRCACCHGQLEDVRRKLHPKPKCNRAAATNIQKEGVVHAIKRCSGCSTEAKDGARHARYVHRDINAAYNIANVYFTLASCGARPPAFTRSISS